MLDSAAFSDSLISQVHAPFLARHDIQLQVMRLDLLPYQAQGNKWFKLKYNLAKAQQLGHSTLLSFGGAYSNHLYALAAVAKTHGFRSIGVVRGELTEPLNPVLEYARNQGMQLYPVSREQYRRKESVEFQHEMLEKYGKCYVIPEGGNNAEGVAGCEEIVNLAMPWLEKKAADKQLLLALACGTGSTMAGVIRGVINNSLDLEVLGVPVLKGASFLENEIARWLPKPEQSSHCRWRLELDYHFGGYGKCSAALTDFIDNFGLDNTIPLEPVYTGKLFYALYDLIRKGRMQPGTRIVALHTGGILQE